MIAYLVLFGRSVDVPQADGMVIAGREQVAVQVRVPGESVALLLVSLEPQIRNADTVWVGLGRVLGVVEDKDIATRGLGGDDAGILRHVASAVDFALVVDLDLDLNLSGHAAKAAELALLVVIVRRVKLGVFIGQLH